MTKLHPITPTEVGKKAFVPYKADYVFFTDR
jgi:hypothetical protein